MSEAITFNIGVVDSFCIIIDSFCEFILYVKTVLPLPQSMLTPRRDLIQPSKSISSTPYSKIQRADSDPIRRLSLSFNGTVTTPTKPPTIFENPGNVEVSSLVTTAKMGLQRTPRVKSEEENEHVNDMISLATPTEVADEGNEMNIEGALTDELKILQDKNRHLYRQIEVVHVTICVFRFIL